VDIFYFASVGAVFASVGAILRPLVQFCVRWCNFASVGAILRPLVQLRINGFEQMSLLIIKCMHATVASRAIRNPV